MKESDKRCSTCGRWPGLGRGGCNVFRAEMGETRWNGQKKCWRPPGTIYIWDEEEQVDD